MSNRVVVTISYYRDNVRYNKTGVITVDDVALENPLDAINQSMQKTAPLFADVFSPKMPFDILIKKC